MEVGLTLGQCSTEPFPLPLFNRQHTRTNTGLLNWHLSPELSKLQAVPLTAFPGDYTYCHHGSPYPQISQMTATERVQSLPLTTSEHQAHPGLYQRLTIEMDSQSYYTFIISQAEAPLPAPLRLDHRARPANAGRYQGRGMR